MIEEREQNHMSIEKTRLNTDLSTILHEGYSEPGKINEFVNLGQEFLSYKKNKNPDLKGKLVANDQITMIHDRMMNVDAPTTVRLSDVRKSIKNFVTVESKQKLEKNAVDTRYLSKLMNYAYQGKDELNSPVDRYGSAERVDVFNERSFKSIKNPYSLLMCLRYLEAISGKPISYGLKVIPQRGKCSYVPFVLEYDDTNSDGIFYVDQKREITVKNILKIEKIVREAKLNGAKIIANQLGVPAKKFVERLNDENRYSFELIQFDSMIKEIGMTLHIDC